MTMQPINVETLTPKQVTEFLDQYIIGQEQAKKSLAIVLRNRWRRQQVKTELKDEITPRNILMIGPTGVGKTEIARRVAKLIKAPFIKVEASKFTEVGYVGRDVESIIRDLTEISINLVRQEKLANTIGINSTDTKLPFCSFTSISINLSSRLPDATF